MTRFLLIFALIFSSFLGDKAFAQTPYIQELRKKAEEGEMFSILRLSQIYIVDATEPKLKQAYAMLKNMVKEKAESHPQSLEGRVVGLSYLELGKLYMNGTAPDVKAPDFARAFEFFQQAAIFYGDVDAQYMLAKLYLAAPSGLKYDPKQAVRWLTLAANKTHIEAQSELGYILYQGKYVPRNAPLGLMYLTLARDGAHDNVTIIDRYNESMANASDSEREQALALVVKWVGSDGK